MTEQSEKEDSTTHLLKLVLELGKESQSEDDSQNESDLVIEEITLEYENEVQAFIIVS